MAVPADGRVTIDVNLVAGTAQTLYLVALGSCLKEDLTSIATLAALQNYTVDCLKSDDGMWSSAVTSDADMPYAGYASGVDIVRVGDIGALRYNSAADLQAGISLRALLAKISLHFSFDVSDYSLLSLHLQSVPVFFSIEPGRVSDLIYHDLAPVLIADITTTDTDGRKVYTWYIPQNLQGTIDEITVESDRYSAKAPARATYLQALVSNTSVSNLFATYSLYVGNNNTSNFDVEANSHYMLSTDINISPESKDNRILSFVHVEEVVFKSSSDGENYDFDAHYDVRPFIITTATQKVKLEIQNIDGTPVGNDSWLKVSGDENYTLAYNNHSLATSVETDIIVPTRRTFYLYSDEYVEPDAPKRSLHVVLSTSALDGSHPTKRTFRVNQRSLLSVGRFGGEFDVTKGMYTRRLGCETIEEYNYLYTTSGNETHSSGPIYGYFRVDTRAAGYGTDNVHNGRVATRYLAENPQDLVVTNTSSNTGAYSFLPPVKRNGKIDLYQYSYYNSFAAARYCYDKNRDLNGNGVIDYTNDPSTNELKWYLPSECQLMGLYVSVPKKYVNRACSVTERTSEDAFALDCGWSSTWRIDFTYYGKSSSRGAWCVREFE